MALLLSYTHSRILATRCGCIPHPSVPRYIKTLFALYGIHFDGIVNGTRHLNEVQKGHTQTLPQKVPSHYGISLYVDDESVICTYGREYGFDAFQLKAPDDEWKEKVLERAFEVKRKAFRHNSQ